MQGTRKVAHMKGRSNKLVDLPAGAKPQRTRKRLAAHAVSEAITTQQSDSILNSKEVNTMTMSKNQANARALKSDISAIPEGASACADTVEKIIAEPTEHLIRLYSALDNGSITDIGKIELAIAELCIKSKNGQVDGAVTDWLTVHEISPKRKNEILEDAIEVLETKMDESKNILETATVENDHSRRRQVAILSSVATSALVGGAKMLMNDNFGKGEILKTVAGAAISGTVTTVTMNALSDKELGNMESAGIGAGIGLVIGGSLTFGLDMFCAGENDGSESVSELPAPVEV